MATNPAIPRPSSSLIVIDSSNRVLMVERNPNSKSFAGAYVFPGGNYDPQQDTSNKLTAIRETFEEAGLLLATPTAATTHPLTQATLEAARKAVHAQHISFTSFLIDNKLTPDTEALHPFTQWITPPMVPRRFHTHFFVTFLSSSSVGFSSAQGLQHLPTSDGGIEVISVRFVKPRDAIAEFQAEKILLLPPQFYLLSTLASILSGDVTTFDQKESISQLARGSFGRLIVNPRALPEKDERGLTVLTYEGDELRGGYPGARHRAHVRSSKGTMQVVTLERNIDIFSEAFLQPDRKGDPKL
ncbi:hypothetical protein K439DRAFT_1633824 [Ramaria rubella]|nr:hypothetical protein K439DRAFT_1633824 [Ramaria rubella]